MSQTGKEPVQQDFYKVRNCVVRPRGIRVNGKSVHGLDLAPRPIRRQGQKRICIATACDRTYAMGGAGLIKSIQNHTDCSGVVFKIITADELVVRDFGKEHCHFLTDEIRSRYDGVKYTPELPKDRYHTSWYRFEMFSFEGYDRVICIDSDCLCVEDISYLFSEELDGYDLVSVEDHIVSKCFTKCFPELESMGLNLNGLKSRIANGQIDVQPALLVANPSIANMAWYDRLIHFANTSGFTYSIDEGILNEFIYNDGIKIKLLPLEWDYQDLYEAHCPELPVPSRPKIVHCQQSKPFLKKYHDVPPTVKRWHVKWWKEFLKQ